MSGHPRQRAIGKALHKVCGKEMDPLDWVCARIEDGQTREEIAQELQKLVPLDGEPLNRWALRRWLFAEYGEDVADQALTHAEKHGAVNKIEDARTDLKRADPDPATGEVAKAKELARLAQWEAERAHPERFGGPAKTQVNLNMSVGQLHLDALRAKAITRLAAVSAPALPAPEEEAEVIEDSPDGATPLTEAE